MNWDEALKQGEDSGPPPPEEPPAPSEGPSPLDRSAQQPMNDYGNGQRMVIHFGGDLMFVPRLGWFAWDGQVWAQDFDGMRVRKTAHRIPKLIAEEATRRKFSDRDAAILKAAEDGREAYEALLARPRAELGEAGVAEMARLRELATAAGKVKDRAAKMRAEHLRFAKSSGNSAKITNMLQEAEPYVEQRVDALNTDPLALNCRSGTLGFVRDEADGSWKLDLRPHNRADMITKMMPVEYDPAAECPAFLDFLERVQPLPSLQDFLQRWFGYSLTGLTAEQKLVFFHGAGRNGKSTLVDLIARIMGEYATSVPIESLTGTEQRKGGDATPDLVRLPGARMVRASEPEEGIRFREATVKTFTGGEPLLIRRMREEFVEVETVFKLTISGNHKPEIRGDDDGIWRRVLLVPFDVQIPKAERIPLPELVESLMAEGPGILNWLVAGLIDYLEGGLADPKAVLDATQEYRDDSDPIGQFLTSACVVTGEPNDTTTARTLSEALAL